MASHDPTNVTALRFDDVPTVDGHGIAVVVILECSGGRAQATEVIVKKEMPWRDPSQQLGAIADCGIVRKVLFTVARVAQCARLTFVKGALTRRSVRAHARTAERRMTCPTLSLRQKN